MREFLNNLLSGLAASQRREIAAAWARMVERGPDKVQFWFIALVIGIGAGFAALGFRLGIEKLQAMLYRTSDIAHLHSHAGTLPWYWVLLLPMFGGLAVGVIQAGLISQPCRVCAHQATAAR